MTGPVKKQSNPFSTGGGGATFEARVQAAFTVLMLTGRVAPCLPPWPITKLKLQGRYAGFNTDDFIVFARQPQAEREAKLMAQIKHKVSITAKDDTFCEVVQAAWTDFNGQSFNRETDAFALIAGPLSATDIDNVRPLLEWARFSEDENEFLSKVGAANFSSDAKRAKLEVFRAHLASELRLKLRVLSGILGGLSHGPHGGQGFGLAVLPNPRVLVAAHHPVGGVVV